MTKHIRFLSAIGLLALVSIHSQAGELKRREWKVDGVTREALVYTPDKAKTESTPVIFAFHGHGGRMAMSARMFHYETEWPEAIVVYPQGLNTPGLLSDPEGARPGWQHGPGNQDDRDLKFFDAMLASLKEEYRIDAKRIYATGHSNGGTFTYLLWTARADVFAAFAPCGSAMREVTTPTKPKPVLHLAGEEDPKVKFEWQKRTMDKLRKLNECGEGKAWGKYCTRYESKVDSPVVTYIHPGKHEFPREASRTIVKFFKEQAKS